MKVERTIQIRWRLLGGCAVLLLAPLGFAKASVPRADAPLGLACEF